ncbi:MAG: hypothetical protein WA633_14810 [Stellaceae bacterium]
MLGLGQRRLDDPGDARRDLVLHREDVAEVAVIALGPDVGTRYCVDNCAVIRTRPPALRTLPSST